MASSAGIYTSNITITSLRIYASAGGVWQSLVSPVLLGLSVTIRASDVEHPDSETLIANLSGLTFVWTVDLIMQVDLGICSIAHSRGVAKPSEPFSWQMELH